MTLARYLGPKRAYVGAIGELAPDGVRLNGRLIRGDVAPVRYVVTCEGEPLSTWRTWSGGLAGLAHATGGEVSQAPPSAAGLEMIAAERVYRLDVIG